MSRRIAPGLESMAVPIDELHLLDGNPRQGDVPAVMRSLDRFGQRSPILYREEHDPDTGEQRKVVYAGNHRLRAARELGWAEVAAIDAADLSHDEVKAFALADNRTGDLGTYDDELLAIALEEVRAADPSLLADSGFDDDALSELLDGWSADGGAAGADAAADADDVPEVDEGPPVTKRGDVWLLGEHRVLCGDAYDAGSMPQSCDVVLTDPPYGMALDTNYDKMGSAAQGRTYRPVIGDDRPFDMADVPVPDCGEQFWFGADWYRHSTPEGGTFLAWDKRVNPEHDAVIGSMFELIWSAKRHQRVLLRYAWTAYDQQREPDAGVHPTQKPVAMLVEMLDRWSKPGAVVLDPFGGSGSTLIACHDIGDRVAHLVEIDEHYVDVICRRFQRHTGVVPILEATGEPHDFGE